MLAALAAVLSLAVARDVRGADALGAGGLLDPAFPVREIERSASVFHSYEFKSVIDTPAPCGFTPFYISHYGRHGSRRLTGTFLADVLDVLESAQKNGLLTDSGQSLLTDVRKIAEAHDGMVGQLTERGAEEHRTLARRMAARFQDVFAGGKRVRCQSSTYPRVLVSQANFTMALKDAAPLLLFDFVTGDKFLNLLNGPQLSRDEVNADARIRESVNAYAASAVNPLPIVKRFFAQDFAPGESLKFVRDLFVCASICQCMSRELAGLDIYRFFMSPEIEAISRVLEAEHYAVMANSAEFGDIQLRGSRNLARDFAIRAEEAIADGSIAADLRFGHDSGLWPLAGLIGIDGPGDRAPFACSWEACPAWKWMPMAANLQMVFYRNGKDEVLVKVLYNEREMHIRGLEPVSWPYYRWSDLRKRFLREEKDFIKPRATATTDSSATRSASRNATMCALWQVETACLHG